MKKILPTLILALLVWSCSKKMAPAQSETPSSNTGTVINQPKPVGASTPENTPAVVSTTTTSQGSIENTGTMGSKVAPTGSTAEANAAIAGQATFNAKCGRCHGLKSTYDYTADRWASILAVMAPKANLSETEKANVYAYVKANAKK